MEKKEIMDLVNSWKCAVRAAEECRDRISTMKAKAADLEGEIPDKSLLLEEMKRNKDLAFDAFIVGKISQTELDETKARYEQAQKDCSDCQEMAEAARRAITRAKDELPRLDQAAASAKIKLWNSITKDLTEKAVAAVGDRFARAYAASCQCSGGNFGGLIFNAFGGSPPTDELNRMRGEIEKEYLINK
jgi:hypothetical protein